MLWTTRRRPTPIACGKPARGPQASASWAPRRSRRATGWRCSPSTTTWASPRSPPGSLQGRPMEEERGGTPLLPPLPTSTWAPRAWKSTRASASWGPQRASCWAQRSTA
eukprot:405558-Lingulodinium_polyedra.AAC.1